MESAVANPHRIDVHHYVFPVPYMRREGPRVLASMDVDPTPIANWSPARSVEEMDRHGIVTAVVSISTPGIWFGDVQAACSLARECNDAMAQMVKDHPGRFGFFAAIPLPDVEGGLAEIDYALGVLKADGIGILTSYQIGQSDKWPGDTSFAPIFDELNRRGAAVFIHPTAPGCCRNLIPGIPAPLTEFYFDSTRALTSLLFSGTFTRCSNIRFIFTHAGAAMPPLATRMTSFGQRHKELAERVPNGVMPELQRLHYDIANSTAPSSLGALKSLVPISQILFGSDYPFIPIAVTAKGFDANRSQLSAAEIQAINRDNALAMFPRLCR